MKGERKMNYEEVKDRLLRERETREAYENPPLTLVVARSVVLRRRTVGMTQEQLAQAIGTSQNQVWRIESGQANITLDTLDRLARALKISVYELILDAPEEIDKSAGFVEKV